MDSVGIWVAVAAIGYLLGSFPTAYLVVKHFAHKDIHQWGTGNVGTLNTYRATNSKSLTLTTLAGDVLKATLAITIGHYLTASAGLQPSVGASIGGIAAVSGHNYPIFLRFKGGKGIASSTPLLVYFDPLMVGIWVLTFLAVVAVSRWLVLGQIIATLSIPVIATFFFPDGAIAIYFLAALVFVRHAPRLKDLLAGTEPKMYYKVRNRP